jgi:hypothetical protein
MKKLMYLSLLLLAPFHVWAQGNGVADAAAEYVNMYTGDFNYSVPIVVVPGPNGESFPVTASYSAGIGMDQMSSWVGLGWSINAGEISRKVNGAPDDWKGVVLQKKIATDPNYTNTEEMYGPLYFDDVVSTGANNIGTPAKVMDVYYSNYKLIGGTGSPFMFPDYDQYSFNGGGLDGVMQPHIFKYGNIFTADVSGNIDFAAAMTDFGNTYGKVQFRMKNENTRILAPHYSNSVVLSNIDPGDPNSVAWVKSPSQVSGDYTSNYSDPTKKWTAYHIEYVTNSEINSSACTLQSQGYVNLKPVGSTASCSAAYRSTTTFPADGIGAYKITAPNGFVYHYTLPVYSYDENIRTFEVNTSYAVDGGVQSTEYKRDARYATTWKLTAITGPDYTDANSNGLTDEGDTGYWISLEYGQWMDAYEVLYPYTDYAYDINSSKLYEASQATWQENPTKYKGSGTIIKGKSEIYYLNKIKTATHTAFFVKDIKMDDHDLSGTNKRPTLRLSHVILMTNADVTANNIFSTNSSLINTTGFVTGSTDVKKDNIIHLGSYQTYQTVIQQKALQIVEFNHDYKLCPKYVRNINTSTTANSISTNGVVYKEYVSATGAATTSGKLTLNSLTFHQENYDHLYGDYFFTYGTSAKNPDYHPLKKDFWGMYKSDFDATKRGNYTTPGTGGSYANTDAWSMVQVKNPLGSTINMEYESDEYEWAGDHYSLQSSGLRRPARYFMIKDIVFSNNYLSAMDVTLFDKDAVPYLGLSATDYDKKTVAFRFTPTSTVCSTATTYADCYAGGNIPLSYMPGHLYYNENPGFTSLTPSTLQTTLSGTSSLTIGCNAYSGCTWTSPDYENGGFSSAGYIKLDMNKVYGGGIRVKSITTSDPYTGTNYKLKYTYQTGICTNDPDRFGPEKYRGILLSNFYNKDRHAPSPNVGYSYVTVQAEGAAGTSSNQNGKVKYKFQNYMATNIGNVYYYLDNDCAHYTSGFYSPNIWGAIHVGEHNYVMGAVLRQEVYDTKDNLVLLSENEYRKMNDIGGDADDQFNTGRVDEIFYSSYNPQTDIQFGGSCHGSPYVNMAYYKTQYNYALAKTTTTVDGMTVTTEYRNRDKLTGTPTLIITSDPTYGERTTRKNMAWQTFTTMGPKSVNSTYANILGPVDWVKTYSGLVTSNSDFNIIESSKTDFSNFSGVNKYLVWNSGNGRYELSTNPNSYTIWGSDKSYVWKADLQTNGLFTNTNTSWKLLEETTVKNKKNQVLEARVLDKRYSCVKMGYNNKYPIAEIADANYFSFTYSGFESTTSLSGGITHFDAEVQNGTIQSSSSTAHTGKYEAAIGANTLIYKAAICTTGNNGIIIEPTGSTDAGSRTFRFSVWSKSTNSSTSGLQIVVNGTTYSITNANADYTVGNWSRLTKDITISTSANGSNVEVSLLKGSSTTAYFDDFRFSPIDAPMMSYVYDDKTGRVTHMLDADNLYVRFEYDNAGRVINTYQETPPEGSYTGGEKKVSTNVYHIHQ